MKAVHGALDLNNNYSFVSLDICGDGFICHNCGKPIKKVMTIKDSKGLFFDVGIDCGDALIEASLNLPALREVMQAKKELAQKVRFITFLKKKLDRVVLNDGVYFLYEKNKNDWKYRFFNLDSLDDTYKETILSKVV